MMAPRASGRTVSGMMRYRAITTSRHSSRCMASGASRCGSWWLMA